MYIKLLILITSEGSSDLEGELRNFALQIFILFDSYKKNIHHYLCNFLMKRIEVTTLLVAAQRDSNSFGKCRKLSSAGFSF